MKVLLLLLALNQQFLLRDQIQSALQLKNYSPLENVCQERIAVNLEEPFSLNGYFWRSQFLFNFATLYQNYTIDTIDWSSMQVEDKQAVETLNVRLRERLTQKMIIYKFIFFMEKDKVWRIFYLRGLKM